MEADQPTRILFVEDEPLALELMGKTLREHGYVIEAFACPCEALNWLGQHRDEIDVLVTDQSMPRLTGIELAHKAREHRPGLPVVLVTGMGKIEKGLSDGGPVSLIEKPYKRSELFNAIEMIIGGEQ